VPVLSDGGKTYTFKLEGGTVGGYAVVSDGHGGTMIGPNTAHFVQLAAAFAPSDAGKMAVVSSTTPTAAPFLHATASATAGHV
jgi:hypothetical protein